MIDWAGIELAIFNWVAGAVPAGITESQIVRADQNIDQPAYPFITLRKENFQIIEGPCSEDRRFFDEDTGELFIVVLSQLEFDIQVRGHVDESCPPGNLSNAFFFLTDLMCGLDLPSARSALREAELVVVSQNPVLDISSTLNNKWISRATTEIRVRVCTTKREAVDYFESVAIDGKCGETSKSFTIPKEKTSYGSN